MTSKKRLILIGVLLIASLIAATVVIAQQRRLPRPGPWGVVRNGQRLNTKRFNAEAAENAEGNTELEGLEAHSGPDGPSIIWLIDRARPGSPRPPKAESRMPNAAIPFSALRALRVHHLLFTTPHSPLLLVPLFSSDSSAFRLLFLPPNAANSSRSSSPSSSSSSLHHSPFPSSPRSSDPL